jgi:hypothetical protein
VAEKSRHGLGARVMSMMIQTIWHFWCRALWYSVLSALFMIWLACAFVSVIFIPMMMFFSEPPGTLLGKMHIGMFCVSCSFLMLALFIEIFPIILEDDLASDSCMRNVVASKLHKVVKVSATIGFHILTVAGVVLVVRTFMMIWERV